MKFDVFLPDSLADLLRSIDRHGQDVSLIAGGTDLLPRILRGQSRPKLVADLSNLSELDFVRKENGIYRIGALTRISELADCKLLHDRFEALHQVCQQIASPPIRNLATVGGNITGPSSFRDVLMVLMSLGAKAVLKSRSGERVLPIENMRLEEGRMSLGGREILTEVQLQELPSNSWSSFSKVGRRQSFVIPLASLAMFLELELPSNRVKELRSWFNHLHDSIPKKAGRTPSALRNEPLNEDMIAKACEALSAELQASSDFKASSDYRRRIAVMLFKEQLAHCAEMIAKRSR